MVIDWHLFGFSLQTIIIYECIKWIVDGFRLYLKNKKEKATEVSP